MAHFIYADNLGVLHNCCSCEGWHFFFPRLFYASFAPATIASLVKISIIALHGRNLIIAKNAPKNKEKECGI
ncbi:MAG: hypothetical protein HYW64_01885 [Candidatus Levybacteria bacterium]|nr:hypothetical protein [Candidatus Levybacteria bacterium]